MRLTRIAAVLIALFIMFTANADASVIIESKVAQTGIGNWSWIDLQVAHWQFPDINKLSSISSLTVEFTLWDGDTGKGNFDRNDLSLTLDGADTGIVLNGFRHGRMDTRSFTADVDASLSSELMAKLSDNILVGYVVDNDNKDNYLEAPNEYLATLSLTGPSISLATVPVPSAMLLGGIGTMAVSWFRRRRMV